VFFLCLLELSGGWVTRGLFYKLAAGWDAASCQTSMEDAGFSDLPAAVVTHRKVRWPMMLVAASVELLSRRWRRTDLFNSKHRADFYNRPFIKYNYKYSVVPSSLDQLFFEIDQVKLKHIKDKHLSILSTVTMKVLLTGGSGFIAAHCLDMLLEHGCVDTVFDIADLLR